MNLNHLTEQQNHDMRFFGYLIKWFHTARQSLYDKGELLNSEYPDLESYSSLNDEFYNSLSLLIEMGTTILSQHSNRKEQ